MLLGSYDTRDAFKLMNDYNAGVYLGASFNSNLNRNLDCSRSVSVVTLGLVGNFTIRGDNMMGLKYLISDIMERGQLPEGHENLLYKTASFYPFKLTPQKVHIVKEELSNSCTSDLSR